ncbi:cytochrome C [bacterium]|nr:cytochrome C [bacterium]
MVLAFAGLVIFITFFFWYYGSSKYLVVGYRPDQPVAFSHKLHAGDLGMDCRYCHTQVEVSTHANVPPTKTCMNCHDLIGTDNDKLLPVRESWQTGRPIEWVRVHKVPDYAYFNHAVHVQNGVGCVSCHGNVRRMEKVEVVERLSMSWCLDCHRDPDPHLRPVAEITNMTWMPPDDHPEWLTQWKSERNINPPEDCTACHR